MPTREAALAELSAVFHLIAEEYEKGLSLQIRPRSRMGAAAFDLKAAGFELTNLRPCEIRGVRFLLLWRKSVTARSQPP